MVLLILPWGVMQNVLVTFLFCYLCTTLHPYRGCTHLGWKFKRFFYCVLDNE